MSSGTLTFGVETPTGYDAACVVQQHDGKLLILGKNKITYLVFLFNTALAISGGYFTAQSVYRHDPVTKTFETLPNLQARSCILVVPSFTVQSIIIVQ